MKTQISVITVLLISLIGCYTQFSTVSDSDRRPDFTKIERKLDSSTTQTDYYDNRLYSYYFRHFGAYGSFNHYDPYYPNNYYGSLYSPYYYGYGYYGYDYLDYRMDTWYWNRFGYYNNPYCSPYGYNSGGTIVIVNGNSTPAEPSRRVRQGRNNLDPSLISGQFYLPSVGTNQVSGASSNGASSTILNNSSSSNGPRVGRSTMDFGPVTISGSSTQGASSSVGSSGSSSGSGSGQSSQNSTPAVRSSRSSTETVTAPPPSNNSAPAQTTAQPNNSRSSDSGSSSGRQRQGRNGGN